MQSLSTTNSQSWLVWFLRGLLFLGVLVLMGRLVDLQIIKGEYYKDLANGNRIRRIPISAPRGKILARGGEALADNIEVKKKIIFDSQIGYKKEKVSGNQNSDDAITEWERIYPTGPIAAHITGYLGEVNKDEVNKVNPDCLAKGPRLSGSLIGRSGLEEQYDCKLKGIDGEELVEVDSMGRKMRVLGIKTPIPGQDLTTTIDYDLQEKVAGSLDHKKGMIVVTDPKGQIMALFSSPSFDPAQISKSLVDPNLPLFNRAISGTYHPGSVFKIVTSIAALEDQKIDKNFTFKDEGVIKIGDFSYTNWYFNQYGASEGVINLKRAIARSTDTFFYKIGEFVGAQRLADWSAKFGLNIKTGIDIPGEAQGLIPTPEWKKRVKNEAWFLGNTYHMAIGQGDVALTPIAVNSIISTIASGGLVCAPHLTDEKPGDCKNLNLKKENLDAVKEGLVAACSPGGTASVFFNFTPQVACKTGTAEIQTTGGETHAWFAMYAPAREAEDPELVITVLVEKGGEGSKVAAPIAKEIINFWFHDKTNESPTPKL